MWTDAQLQGQFLTYGGKEYVFRLFTQFQREGDSYAVRVVAMYETTSASVQFGGCQPDDGDVNTVKAAVKAFATEHKIEDLAVEKLKDLVFNRIRVV